MKKCNFRIICLLTALLLVLGMGAVAAEEKPISVVLDGRTLAFQDQNPTIHNDRTLVPFRGVLEAMGVTVDWIGETRTVTAEKGNIKVTLTIDEPVMYKNGQAISLDVPAQIINSRTMVPVRAVSESFDAKVEWNSTTRAVVISTDEVLNEAIKYWETADSYYWCANIDFTYDATPISVQMEQGNNRTKKIEMGSFSMTIGKEKSYNMLIANAEKCYNDLNGKVSEEVTPAGWELAPIISVGTPFLLEKEEGNLRTYRLIDGSNARIVVDKQKKIPTKLIFPKDSLSSLFELNGAVFNSDFGGNLVFGGDQVLTIWKKYAK